MNILEAVVRALIYLACLALAFFLVVWVLGAIGIALPAKVVNILMVIFVLVAILVLIRLFAPSFAGFTLWPPRNPPG